MATLNKALCCELFWRQFWQRVIIRRADGMVVAASHNALLLVGDSTPDEVLKALRTLGIVIRACTTSFFLARVILGIAAFSA